MINSQPTFAHITSAKIGAPGAGCPECTAALAAWAQGGHHLSCRCCEVAATEQRATLARNAFYTSLVAAARAAGMSIQNHHNQERRAA